MQAAEHSVRDDLMAAKALIDTPEKWCKGIVPGQNCTMWALSSAIPLHRGRWADCSNALQRVLPRAQRPVGIQPHPVVAFNDDPETTHADVMALFDRAIAKAGQSPESAT